MVNMTLPNPGPPIEPGWLNDSLTWFGLIWDGSDPFNRLGTIVQQRLCLRAQPSRQFECWEKRNCGEDESEVSRKREAVGNWWLWFLLPHGRWFKYCFSISISHISHFHFPFDCFNVQFLFWQDTRKLQKQSLVWPNWSSFRFVDWIFVL